MTLSLNGFTANSGIIINSSFVIVPRLFLSSLLNLLYNRLISFIETKIMNINI